jgi:hypothetical protein
MLRRSLVVTVCTIAIALALPAIPIGALCAPPSSPDSAAGRRTMVASPFIIWGTIETTVPPDAHAVQSIFLHVRGYFRGMGPARVEVSDTGQGNLPAAADQPGFSSAASADFIRRFGGQDAVVFASREVAPYAGQFQTNACTYTAYGDAAAADILPLLRRVFGAPQPPQIATTGPAAIAGLVIVAMTMITAGGALKFAR